MYRNTYRKKQTLYKDGDVVVMGELGEYAYLHLHMSNSSPSVWRKRAKILSYVKCKLKTMGYRHSFALIPDSVIMFQKGRGKKLFGMEPLISRFGETLYKMENNCG